jgi:CheY-like chemotaxis protein
MLEQAVSDLKRFQSAHSGLSATRQAQSTARETILIIDDDRAFLELSERLLQKEGFSPVTSDVPESALQLARTIKPLAIFVDVLMPKANGWEVIEALKSDPATAHIPVFMLSILEERHKAKNHDAAGFITKPLDTAKLKKAIETVRAGAKAA